MIGGHRSALSRLRPSVDDFLNQLSQFGDQREVDIGQVVVRANSPCLRQTSAECDLRRKWGLTVQAVGAADGSLDMTPDGDHRIAEGKILMVIGSQGAIYKLEKVDEMLAAWSGTSLAGIPPFQKGLEIGSNLLGGVELNGEHADILRAAHVAGKVVDKDGASGRDLKPLKSQAVDAGVWLDDAHLG